MEEKDPNAEITIQVLMENVSNREARKHIIQHLSQLAGTPETTCEIQNGDLTYAKAFPRRIGRQFSRRFFGVCPTRKH